MSDDLYAKMEKDAGIFQQGVAGVRGAWQAGRQMAGTQAARSALHGAETTLHQAGHIPFAPAPTQGAGRNLVERWRAAGQGARQGVQAQRGTEQAARAATQTATRDKQVAQAAQTARGAGRDVPLTPGETTAVRPQAPRGRPTKGGAPAGAAPAGPAAPTAAQPAAQAAPSGQAAQPHFGARAPQAASAAAAAPQGGPIPVQHVAPPPAAAPVAATPAAAPAAAPQSRWQQAKGLARQHGGAAAVGAGVGALGVSAVRGRDTSNEQQARMQDYLAGSHYMQPQPLPSMTVMASYDEFANAKLAALKVALPTRGPSGPDTFGPTHNAFSSAFGQTLAKKLVEEPIDNFHRILKKKIIDDPKAKATFDKVVQDDPILRDAYAQRPGELDETFGAMKKFGPSMVTSPGAMRSFLRQSAMSGGTMDMATIRLLAETEKFIQNSRGRGGP